MRRTRLLFILILILACLYAAVPVAGQPGIGNLNAAAVYFELFPSHFHNDNLELIRDGFVRVYSYPPFAMDDIQLYNERQFDQTAWVQIEDFRYLLPLVTSDLKSDRQLAKGWIARWRASPAGEHPKKWAEPMAVAYRAMVLTLFLKTEHNRAQPDEDLLVTLRDEIFRHQNYLKDAGHFDTDSNHGIVESIGLLETTRVIPDDDVLDLGIKRLHEMVSNSFSPGGFHKEHATWYHFLFLRWTIQANEYVRQWVTDDNPYLDVVEQTIDRARRASYYLYDHDMQLPQIGDADSISIKVTFPELIVKRPPKAAFVDDRDAGYAIYKGRGSDKRYVVFCHQSRFLQQRRHHHDDVGAVFVSWDGETILGDSGKFAYPRSAHRMFVVGAPAHSTVFPALFLTPTNRPIVLADSVWSFEGGNEIRVGIHAEREGLGIHSQTNRAKALVQTRLRRELFIPQNTQRIVVRDSVNSLQGPSVIAWQIGRDVVTVERSDDQWALTTRRGKKYLLSIRIETPDDTASVDTSIVSGETNPIMGWYSPRTSVKRPSPVIMVQFEGRVIVETVLERKSERRGVFRLFWPW